MMHGRRPILSDSAPTNGIRNTATMFPDTEIQRYMVVLKPMPYSSLVAYAAPKTVAAVGTAFISAMQMTRSISTPVSRATTAMGGAGHLALLGLLLERGRLVDLP